MANILRVAARNEVLAEKTPSSSSERAQPLSRAGAGLTRALAALCCCWLVVVVELARAGEVNATSSECWFVSFCRDCRIQNNENLDPKEFQLPILDVFWGETTSSH